MTPAWMKRLHFHYHDPKHPDRITEDVAGSVIAIVVLIVLLLPLL